MGVVSALWNAFGGIDYAMTQAGGEVHLRALGMDESTIAHYDATPVWVTAVWAIGVWGALLGSVLLLLRRKWALHAFITSCAAFISSLVYTYALSNDAETLPAEAPIITAVVLAGCLFFIWYAWFSTKRGLLR